MNNCLGLKNHFPTLKKICIPYKTMIDSGYDNSS